MTGKPAPHDSGSRAVARLGADRSWHTEREHLVRAQFDDRSRAAEYAASHEEPGPSGRYFSSRMHAVLEALGHCPGGDLVDVGCGPGVFARQLADARPDEFQVTLVDSSPAMIAEASRSLRGTNTRLAVGDAVNLPFPESSFGVAVAMGVLEYCAVSTVLEECARVVQRNGLVLVTMLNPLSPYRIFEWVVYWPLLRLLGKIEGMLGRAPEARHGPRPSGIRAVPPWKLRRLLRAAGLMPVDIVYYDVTPVVPPVDQVLWKLSRRWQTRPESTLARRGFRRLLGSAYLVVASKSG
ncbi:class I SAM-dependent methyltransferase [Amycolatopsis saalfeldensis]|nr:class I SAM-dependent methyltransferase [Amycolatopsis saalfeldensis]